jgi:hypothetical protein
LHLNNRIIKKLFGFMPPDTIHLSGNVSHSIQESIMSQTPSTAADDRAAATSNPIALVVRARTQARAFPAGHPGAAQLEYLAVRLERILTERRRVQKSLLQTFDE